MRRRAIILGLGVAFMAELGVAPPTSAQTVKLAILAELTGGGAPSGTMWRDGVKLAVEDVNKKGGVLGRRLETFEMDT